MMYENMVKGIFMERPNRFIAHVLVNGITVVAHVKNTGRCRELLIKGVTVYLQYELKATRKTQYSLIAVEKGDKLINMDSQVPNAVVYEALVQRKIEGINPTNIRREATYRDSRFDLYFENKALPCFMEVKGVTLENNGKAKFPDAPTSRGLKHIHHLIHAANHGYGAYIFFLIQMEGIDCFVPNCETDPEFAKGLIEAANSNVTILCYDSLVRYNSIEVHKKINIILK